MFECTKCEQSFMLKSIYLAVCFLTHSHYIGQMWKVLHATRFVLDTSNNNNTSTWTLTIKQKSEFIKTELHSMCALSLYANCYRFFFFPKCKLLTARFTTNFFQFYFNHRLGLHDSARKILKLCEWAKAMANAAGRLIVYSPDK